MLGFVLEIEFDHICNYIKLARHAIMRAAKRYLPVDWTFNRCIAECILVSNMSEDHSTVNNKKQPQQIEYLSPLAVGDQKLNRHLGYFSGTMMNIGQIIGTGIFSNPALILQNCGSGGMMLILWVVGAIFAGTGEYLAYEFPRPKQLISFVFLVTTGVFSRGSGIAQGATVFGSNIIYAIGGPTYTNNWGARGFAAFCITFWIVLNIFSSKLAIRFNNFFTVLKVVLLLLLICVGFAGLAGRLPDRPDLQENFSFNGTSNNSGNYANSIYYVIFAYGGWYNLNYVLDELKEYESFSLPSILVYKSLIYPDLLCVSPIKNLPRCAITALSSTTVLYILANVAYLAVLPVSVIANSNLTVAANLFNKAFGGVFGARVLPVFVGLSSFGFVGVVTYSGSRVILETARQGYLPYDRLFSKVHPKLQTPIYSLLLIYVISLIFLLAPPPGYVFQFIVAFSGYGGYLFCNCLVRYWAVDVAQDAARSEEAYQSANSYMFLHSCIRLDTTKHSFGWISLLPAICDFHCIGGSFCYFMGKYRSILAFIDRNYLLLYAVATQYFKMVRGQGLENSYNAEIASQGHKELYDDVYKDYQSTSSTIDVSDVSEFNDVHTDSVKV
ncbi:hypothetical protein NQZ79_g6582 [Umbelopsis isabellina]|nr:hypothetical protein NQZ79_g6582 [Umbelopsis isabellina]